MILVLLRLKNRRGTAQKARFVHKLSPSSRPWRVVVAKKRLSSWPKSRVTATANVTRLN